MEQPATSTACYSNNAPFRAACITSYRTSGWDELPAKISYLAYGDETCPTTGRPHKQAWAYSNRAMKLSGWKKVFPGDHVEQMRGSFSQNDAYCSKEGQLHEFGEKPMGNGQKRSLQNLCVLVKEAAEEGQMLCDVITDEPNQATFVQYNSGIKQLYNASVTAKLRRIDKNFAPEVIYIYGEPGSGKSRYVREKDPEVFDIPEEDSYKWKDGYSGQEAVVYENISPNNVKAPERLLKEIDRYFIQVPVKGGYIGWRPRRIYFTSVYKPCHFANDCSFSKAQEFLRRITHIINMDTHRGITIERAPEASADIQGSL